MENKTPYNFGGLSKEFSSYEGSKVVILPVPFDKTSTWIKGSDKGPRAIIEASMNLELCDIETGTEVYKKGIYTEEEIIADNSVEIIDEVYRKVRALLNEGKFIVALGGEHSISLGTVKAHADYFDNISILQLDAHSDMRDSYEGEKFSHACVMARIKEISEDIISVGIRSMDSSELKNIDKNRTFFASEFYKPEVDKTPDILKKLSHSVYITIDLDVFDPSVMPSTGTPEPGGLNWYQVTNLLRVVSENKNIIGFDIVELCPSENKAPDFLAAKLIYKLLSYKFLSTNG